MKPDPGPKDPEQIAERSKESLEKARDLVDDLKIVQHYEVSILADDEPPYLSPSARPRSTRSK
jgi:hypothetical protein